MGQFDELGLGSFELHSDLVALFDFFFEILGLCSNPYVLQLASEHASDFGLIGKTIRDRRDENGPRRDAMGVQGRKKICLSQIDVVDTFSRHHEKYECDENPCDASVRCSYS